MPIVSEMKRRLVWKWAAAALLAVLSVTGFLQAGQFLQEPVKAPAKADLIVALGGDSGGRVHKAAALYQQGFAPRVMLTGLEGGYFGTRLNYLNWRARVLVEQGVPETALLFDEISASSWDEAVNTLKLMQAKDFHSVLVVSDPPHLRRLDWVWGKVFAGSGKEYRLIASDMENWDAGRWWRNENSAQFLVMEYVKLGYYLIMH